MSTIRSGIHILRSERERDDKVKQVPCPLCKAAAGVRCDAGLNRVGLRIALSTSHTARYLAAAAVELVPPMKGWPWTG
jgi:hypothetical protein